MIVGTMTTFPARAGTVPAAVASIAPQLDRLNLVLNEHAEVPGWAQEVPNLVPVLPEQDTKDTGKFLVPAEAKDWLFTLDDDIVYPPDYVARTLEMVEALGPSRFMVGYHGAIYRKPRYIRWDFLRRLLGRDLNYVVNSRDIFNLGEALDRAMVVDELGTGVALMRGADVPPFAQVRDAQRFIDARVARWCHEQGIARVCLPRTAGWLVHLDLEESIFIDYTLNKPPEVAAEIRAYAFRDRAVGKLLPVHGPAQPAVASAPQRPHANGEL